MTSNYYPNGRPKWDDQFRETEWERNKRQRTARKFPSASIQNCRDCGGSGRLLAFATINPAEHGQMIECERCRGSGYEPEHKGKV